MKQRIVVTVHFNLSTFYAVICVVGRRERIMKEYCNLTIRGFSRSLLL